MQAARFMNHGFLINMEDPESEWKIQEYSSSSSNKPTVVRRILSNGYVIGKEFVMTGIFISSAPLVVPPLAVVSTVGFVFTVPFGVLFASYACTNKIMSMLLPAPVVVPLPLRLEYYSSDEDYVRMQCKLGLGFDEDVVGTKEDYYGPEVEGYVINKEDNELVEQLDISGNYGVQVEGYVTYKEDNEVGEDVNEEVEREIVFKLGDDDFRRANVDEREIQMEDDMFQREISGTKENEREDMEDVKQGVIEMGSTFDDVGDGDQGYEEDAGEYLEGDGSSLEEERLVENWDDESKNGRHEVYGDVMLWDEGRVDNMVKDACFVSGSASDVFGDVKDVGTTIPVTSESVASDVVFGDVEDVRTTIPVTSEGASDVVFGDFKEVGTTILAAVGEIESEKLSEIGSTNVEQIGEMRHVVILSDVDVDEIEGGVEVQDDMLQRENVTKEKEREQVEDVIGVEMRLQSFDVAGDDDDDQGYEEGVEEYREGDEDSLEEEMKGEKLLVDNRQEVNEDAKVMDVETTKPVKSESDSNVIFGDIKDVETSKPVTSKSAFNDCFGDAKDVETTQSVTSESASNVVFGDVKDVKTTKRVINESDSNVVFGDDEDVRTTEPITVIEIESEKLVGKGSTNDEPAGEMRHVVIVADENDAKVEELDLVARKMIEANEDERSIESDEKVLRESMGSHENNGGDAYNDANEDAIMITMEEHLIHSIADAREIGEENLLDERNTNNNLEVGNEVKEKATDDMDVLACAPSKPDVDNRNGNEVKEDAADDNVKRDTHNGNDMKENTADDNGNKVKKNAADDNENVLARTPSKHDTDNAKVVYKKMPSREENLDDEKIWEKIAAMKTIVGYKAPTQPTCIGELKALYVFTGVEPPASFDGDSDLDAKLKFLMAIVGVK